MALFRDGKLVHMIPRHQIEGRMPEQIAGELRTAFDTFCKKPDE
jgi:putative YphP/YqiW family bacilliredoxin